MATMPKKHTQDGDIPFPNPPGDGVTSLAMNGTLQSQSTMAIAGSWDNGVSDGPPLLVHCAANTSHRSNLLFSCTDSCIATNCSTKAWGGR